MTSQPADDPGAAPAAETPANLWEPADGLPAPGAPEAAPSAFVLGVVGDSGSGKNTVADAVARLLGPERITDVRLDDYHRFTREERAARALTALNPVVHNLALMHEHLRLLRQGRPILNRSYNHDRGTFGPIRKIEPNEIVLVRGLLGFPTRELLSLYDLAVFLHPEPELLFRWKLRRDVLFRGYTEADVLKYIARHLLDAKEFILPQSERAHMLVHYELPDWEAPDSEVSTTIRLRRGAAELARRNGLVPAIGIEQTEDGDDVVLRVPATLDGQRVEEWGRSCTSLRYDPATAGAYYDETGVLQHLPNLAFVEVLIAHLATSLAAGPRPKP